MPLDEEFMAFLNTEQKFGSLTKFFHWTIFLLLCLQFILAQLFDYYPEDSSEFYRTIVWHETNGVLILISILGLFISRFLGKRPPYPAQVATWEKALSRLTHVLLFAFLFFIPLIGIGMSWFSGYDVAFFKWSIPSPFAANKYMANLFHELHEIFAFIAFGLIVLHIAAALFHHFVRKDNILNRMRPFGKV